MGAETAIEWTDKTFNPWWGCAKVSPGCDHCYAEAWAKRTGTAPWGVDTPRREFGPKHWNEPMRWHLQALREGRRFRVFCASMADVFDKNAPAGARERLWHLIANTPSLDWQLLTKRIGNVRRMLPADWGSGWANVWLGISVVNQEEADRDIPKLLAVPAHVRFLSCEPLLGALDLRPYLEGEEDHGVDLSRPVGARVGCTVGWRPPLDWVISGGESGPKARPSHPDWHRALRDQCHAADVPFLFKQWGEWAPDNCQGPNVWQHLERKRARWNGQAFAFEPAQGWPDDENLLFRLGKESAGRTLDGRTHDGYPQ